VSFPKDGETTLNKTPEKRYQRKIRIGPFHPTMSDNFLEKRKISSKGFDKLE
jgi:hypothetical protein